MAHIVPSVTSQGWVSVSSEYVGRHRSARAVSRVSVPGSAFKAPPRRIVRPLIHAGATVVLAGAAVTSYLTATPADGVGGAEAGLAMEISRATVDPANLASAQSHLAGVPAFDAAEVDREVGSGNNAIISRVQASAGAAAAEEARLAEERQAEADRVARDAQREAVLSNARQDPKSVARVMVADRGWNDAQFQCLVRLWQKESNWRYTARNPSSGAYGIPQSLPGSKMASPRLRSSGASAISPRATARRAAHGRTPSRSTGTDRRLL